MHFGTEVGPKNQGKDQNSSREHQVEDELCVGHTDKIVEGESKTLPKLVGNTKAGLNTELASSSSGLEGIDITKQHHRKGKEKKASGTKAPKVLKSLNPSSGSKPRPYQRVAKKYSTPENEANNPRSSSSPRVGWAMWFKNRLVPVLDEMIAQIKASPTTMMGKAEEELCVAWKHLFPITPTSTITGNLALDHPARETTPNPWWQFITDAPLIIEEVAISLNKQRRPLVVPHLDEFGWIM